MSSSSLISNARIRAKSPYANITLRRDIVQKEQQVSLKTTFVDMLSYFAGIFVSLLKTAQTLLAGHHGFKMKLAMSRTLYGTNSEVEDAHDQLGEGGEPVSKEAAKVAFKKRVFNRQELQGYYIGFRFFSILKVVSCCCKR